LIGVAARVVAQQIADRAQVELAGKQCRSLRVDYSVQRIFNAGHCSFHSYQ
jgi:hypothetical protein